jgi:hypothetical protein
MIILINSINIIVTNIMKSFVANSNTIYLKKKFSSVLFRYKQYLHTLKISILIMIHYFKVLYYLLIHLINNLSIEKV